MSSTSNQVRDVPIGASVTFRKTVSEADVYLYAGVTGDFSPNHVDEEYMRRGRYGHRIAHGALLIGFMSAASARLPLGRTVSLGYDHVRFTGPVYFGDTVEIEYIVREYDAKRGRVYSDVSCKNQRGEIVAVAVHIRAFVE